MKVTSASALVVLLALNAVSPAHSTPSSITMEVDARDVVRGIQHVRLLIPVQQGPLTLVYPKWIPGEHAPTGPLTQMVSLKIGGDRPLPWRRDVLEPFSFHIDVPAGVNPLQVEFDYLSPPKAFGSGYGKTSSVTPHLLILLFNHLVLYPTGTNSDSLRVKANVRLPVDWGFDVALEANRTQNGAISLSETSLTTLVDSPLLAGEFFRTIPITSGERSTRMSIASDSQRDLTVNESTIDGMRRLVSEAHALFGVEHYRQYVWLIALGNSLDTQEGLEHYESTDIRDVETFFGDVERQIESRTIPHEFVHSWNGKYRRPTGLLTRNFQEPMVDDLLWVYEGMTRYLGDLILRTRSGLITQHSAREYLAWVAATMDLDRPGRAWRSLSDTAVALPGYTDAPQEWTPIRRKLDYYDEMLLVWLDADTLIRQRTGGKRSLDYLCRLFFGGADHAPVVRAYSRDDLLSALQATTPLDWHAFLTARVDVINTGAPLEGVKRGGWKLVYDDTPNEFFMAREKVDEADNLSLSLGLWVKADGTVVDVVHGSPAYAVGVAPMMRILVIAGQKWASDLARASIVSAEKSPEPIEVVVESSNRIRTLRIDYHGGLRNPHLARDTGRADLLSQILAPAAAEPR